MNVTKVVLRNCELTTQNSYIIDTLDIFKNKNLSINSGKVGIYPYISIDCNFNISKRKTKQLKSKLKDLLGAEHVDFEIKQ